MKEKLVGQMDGEEFDSLLERFIETQSGPDEPLPGEVFFDLWADIEEGRAPIEINGVVVEGRLVLLPPASASVPVTVSENEIVLGDQVIKIRLVSS